MAPRPRCPVCRSRRWHRDALSGSIVCEEGHLLTGYVQESNEQEYASQHVLQTRRERKNKGKKEKPPSNDYFHGDRSTFLVWQCMQLILREQLRVMIDELGWPVELEAVTRDLFALLVASSRVPPAPSDYERGQEAAGSYSGPRPGDRYTKRGRAKYGPRGGAKSKERHGSEEPVVPIDGDEDTTRADTTIEAEQMQGDTTEAGGSETSSGQSSPSSYFSDADDERPRPGARSRRNSPMNMTTPTTDASAPTGALTSGANPYLPPKARPPLHGIAPRQTDDPRAQPRMDYLLYLIYLACASLRLPVFLSDIFHLAETYQIPYLDAVIHLPAEMQLHLSPSNRRLLSPLTLPSLSPASIVVQDRTSAQAWLARLVNMFRDDWEVEFPEANFPLIAGRLCRLLALPPIAHVLSERILSLLPQPLSFHLPTHMSSHVRRSFSPRNAALAGSSRREKGLPPEFSWSAKLAESSQDWRMILPELKVASVLIVVTKLLWGLERFDGLSETFLDQSCKDLPDVERWISTVQAIANLEKPGDPSKLWRGEAETMKDEEIDAYLDFFEAKIVSKAKMPKRMEDLSRFFAKPPIREASLERATPDEYTSQIDSLTKALYSSAPGSSDHPSIPATRYPAYLASSSAEELPGPLSHLLVAICSHTLPVPTSLPPGLQSSAPTLGSTSVAYLLPQVTLVERLLAIRSVPFQRQAAAEARTEERQLWNETKALAQEFIREQWKTEKARRKEVDQRIETSIREARGQRRRDKEKRRERRQAKHKQKANTKETIGDSSDAEVEAEIERELREQQIRSKSVVDTSDEDEGDEEEEDDDEEDGESTSSSSTDRSKSGDGEEADDDTSSDVE